MKLRMTIISLFVIVVGASFVIFSLTQDKKLISPKTVKDADVSEQKVETSVPTSSPAQAVVQNTETVSNLNWVVSPEMIIASDKACKEGTYEWIPGEATTSPDGHYNVFRDYGIGGFCIRDIQGKVFKIYQLDIPKGWRYDHFSEDGNTLYYLTGFYELTGNLSAEEEKDAENEAKIKRYGLHQLDLKSGKVVLIKPWSWE